MVLNEFGSWRRRSWRLIPAGDPATAADSTSAPVPTIPANPGGSSNDTGFGNLSWSRTGILAFSGYDVAMPAGEYVLDTNRPASEMATARRLPLPSCILLGSAQNTADYLTPDGTKIIVALAKPIPPGQRPHGCSAARHEAHRASAGPGAGVWATPARRGKSQLTGSAGAPAASAQ